MAGAAGDQLVKKCDVFVECGLVVAVGAERGVAALRWPAGALGRARAGRRAARLVKLHLLHGDVPQRAATAAVGLRRFPADHEIPKNRGRLRSAAVLLSL